MPSAVYGTRSVPTTLESNNLFPRGRLVSRSRCSSGTACFGVGWTGGGEDLGACGGGDCQRAAGGIGHGILLAIGWMSASLSAATEDCYSHQVVMPLSSRDLTSQNVMLRASENGVWLTDAVPPGYIRE